MTEGLPEKYVEISKKQKENDFLSLEVSRRYNLLMKAFWQMHIPLTHIERLTFTPQELLAWVEKNATNRRQA